VVAGIGSCENGGCIIIMAATCRNINASLAKAKTASMKWP
jgi:hypothetical protein